MDIGVWPMAMAYFWQYKSEVCSEVRKKSPSYNTFCNLICERSEANFLVLFRSLWIKAAALAKSSLFSQKFKYHLQFF
jgi:hypothetical protein